MQHNSMDTTHMYTKNPRIMKNREPKLMLKKFGF